MQTQITQDITLRGLSARQVKELSIFVQCVLVDGRDWAYHGHVDEDDTPPPPPTSLMAPPPHFFVPVTDAAPSSSPVADVIAPAASTGVAVANGAAPAPVERDTRGVPHHPDFHTDISGKNGGRNNDGSWRRRKGCNKEAADKYEAQFLVATAQALAGTVPPPPPMFAGATVPPPPPLAEPDFPSMAMVDTVTAADCERLWTHLAMHKAVDNSHAEYLKGWLGAAPIGTDLFKTDAARRIALYGWLYARKEQFNV